MAAHVPSIPLPLSCARHLFISRDTLERALQPQANEALLEWCSSFVLVSRAYKNSKKLVLVRELERPSGKGGDSVTDEAQPACLCLRAVEWRRGTLKDICIRPVEVPSKGPKGPKTFMWPISNQFPTDLDFHRGHALLCAFASSVSVRTKILHKVRHFSEIAPLLQAPGASMRRVRAHKQGTFASKPPLAPTLTRDTTVQESGRVEAWGTRGAEHAAFVLFCRPGITKHGMEYLLQHRKDTGDLGFVGGLADPSDMFATDTIIREMTEELDAPFVGTQPSLRFRTNLRKLYVACLRGRFVYTRSTMGADAGDEKARTRPPKRSRQDMVGGDERKEAPTPGVLDTSMLLRLVQTPTPTSKRSAQPPFVVRADAWHRSREHGNEIHGDCVLDVVWITPELHSALSLDPTRENRHDEVDTSVFANGHVWVHETALCGFARTGSGMVNRVRLGSLAADAIHALAFRGEAPFLPMVRARPNMDQEVELFHGTSVQAATLIQRSGFVPSGCTKGCADGECECTMLGTGVYFATSKTRATRFASRVGGVVITAHVKLGWARVASRSRCAHCGVVGVDHVGSWHTRDGFDSLVFLGMRGVGREPEVVVSNPTSIRVVAVESV